MKLSSVKLLFRLSLWCVCGVHLGVFFVRLQRRRGWKCSRYNIVDVNGVLAEYNSKLIRCGGDNGCAVERCDYSHSTAFDLINIFERNTEMLREARHSPASPPYPPIFAPSYGRRTSPPGSPGTKRCCYEGRQRRTSTTTTDAFLCCCYSCPTGNGRPASILTTLGVCCLVLGYTMIGAFAFTAIEGGGSGGGGGREGSAVAASKAEPEGEDAAGNLRTHTVEKLWSITENLNILYKENWTRLASEEVLEFQRALFRTMRNARTVRSYGAPSDGSQHRWTFGSSFLYSLTLITTIGYGSVSPRTPWGKLLTIIYALAGIPLMLLYLSTTGDLLARSFRRLYSKLCNTTATTNKSTCPCAPSTVRVPLTLSLLILVLYISTGTLLFHRLEDWTILESTYFCFTSLGTIGFGELVPGEKSEELSLGVCSGYVLGGMAVVAMCFSLAQEEVMELLRVVGAACTRSQVKMKEEEST